MRRSVLVVLGWTAALACTAPDPGSQPFIYRSVPSATPVAIPGDPLERRITAIELGAADLASERTSGSLILDDRSWDIDDFGDARPRGRRPRVTRVTLTRVADPERMGKDRVLFALELAGRQLEHRLYFSWSPVPAVGAYFLVRGEEDEPQPIVVGLDGTSRRYVSYRHVVPLERVGGPPVDGDAPQGDGISLETTTFSFRDDPRPQDRDHGQISIRGQLGATGSLHYDGNAVSFTPFGERGMQTLKGYRPWKVSFVPAGAPDPSGRRVFELVRESAPGAKPALASGPVPDPDRYFLVLAPTVAGAHRLIVRRHGRIRHVLPLLNRRAREALALLRELAPGSEPERAVIADLRGFVDDDFTLAVERGHVTGIVFLRTLEEVPAPALERLAALPQLQRLTFAHCTELSAPALAALARLTQLTRLELQETPLSDTALSHIAELPRLATLGAYHEGGMHPHAAPLTPAGLAALSRMPLLRSLQLGLESIDDGWVPQLAALQQLESLSLFRSRLSPSAALRLAQALPRSRVTVDLAATMRIESAAGALSVFGGVSGSLLEEIARQGGARDLNVDLRSSPTAAADLDLLSTLTTLRGLRVLLPESLTERGVASVAKLPALETLDLDLADTPGVRVLARLGKLTTLKRLFVSAPALPIEGVLRLLNDLPTAHVSATGSLYQTIEREGGRLRVIEPLDDLELDTLLATQDPRDLSLATARLTPAGLRRLASLQHLERLEIMDDLQDLEAGLDALATLRQLKELVLGGPTRPTDAALEQLERSLPGCKIRALGRP